MKSLPRLQNPNPQTFTIKPPHQYFMVMVMDLGTANVTYRLTWFTILSLGCDRTSSCKSASGSRFQSMFDLTNPTHV